MTSRYAPNEYLVDPSTFGRGDCLWTLPRLGTATRLGASIIHHAHAARWTALIGPNVRAFCRDHDIPYHRYLDMLRGNALMRDEDRAFAANVFGPDAIPDPGEITNYFQQATDDTGVTLVLRKPRRRFNPNLGTFELQQEREFDVVHEGVRWWKNPSVARESGDRPSSMTTTDQDQEQIDLLRTAAVSLYFDADPLRQNLIRVAVDSNGIRAYPHATVFGYFGGGAIRLTAFLRPGDRMFMLAGLLVIDVEEHDDTGRPSKVWALRAVPGSVGFPPFVHADWEYATSLATITYAPDPVAAWEHDDITEAAFAWANDCGAPRQVAGTPPSSFPFQ